MENKNLPLITGRDFCGEVVSKSTNVRKDIRVGDIVYGAVPPHYQGSHASYIVTDDHLVLIYFIRLIMFVFSNHFS